MKNFLSLFTLLIAFTACNKDEETDNTAPTTSDTEVNSSMTVVIGGDTIQTDSVYTRRTAIGGYQIAGVDAEGRMILLDIFEFDGEAYYVTDIFTPPPSLAILNSIEIRDYDGASYHAIAYGGSGFINVTDYDGAEESVTGSFGGELVNIEDAGQSLLIDTAWFEQVTPLILETVPGKADFFHDGELMRDVEVTAFIEAHHIFSILTEENATTEGFFVLVNNPNPDESTIASFVEGPTCYAVSNQAPQNISIAIDSIAETASGYLKHGLFDTYIYFNEVPIELPDFPIESDKLNLKYDNELITFEEYSIETFNPTLSNQLVEVKGWSSSGHYVELGMENDWNGETWQCGYTIFSASLSLFENENAVTPLLTTFGSGNLTSRYDSGETAEVGFVSDEAELSGINLEVNWVE